MGVATGIVALVLFVLGALVSFGPGPGDSDSVRDSVLSVFLKQQAANPTPVPGAIVQPIPPVSQDSESVTVPAPDEAPAPVQSEPRVVESSPVDWATEITDIVAALENESRDREKVRESMWRQTRSVMFEPSNEFVPQEQSPVIANLRFRPEIHVVGLGVKVGSCFIGVPLIGVPVDKRTVGIRLFVCADEPG